MSWFTIQDSWGRGLMTWKPGRFFHVFHHPWCWYNKPCAGKSMTLTMYFHLNLHVLLTCVSMQRRSTMQFWVHFGPIGVVAFWCFHLPRCRWRLPQHAKEWDMRLVFIQIHLQPNQSLLLWNHAACCCWLWNESTIFSALSQEVPPVFIFETCSHLLFRTNCWPPMCCFSGTQFLNSIIQAIARRPAQCSQYLQQRCHDEVEYTNGDEEEKKNIRKHEQWAKLLSLGTGHEACLDEMRTQTCSNKIPYSDQVLLPYLHIFGSGS